MRERIFGEAYSKLIYKRPDALGCPTFCIGPFFDAAKTTKGLVGSLNDESRSLFWIDVGDSVVPVTDLVPKKFVVLSSFEHPSSPTPRPMAVLVELTVADVVRIVVTPHAGTNQSVSELVLGRDGAVLKCVVAGVDETGNADAASVVFLGAATVLAAQLGGGAITQASPRTSRAGAAMRRKRYTLSFTEVALPGVRSESKPHQGGTHASPRQHERRGHWRTYRSGKRVWIKNCVVGDPTLGYVKHDYMVTGALA